MDARWTGRNHLVVVSMLLLLSGPPLLVTPPVLVRTPVPLSALDLAPSLRSSLSRALALSSFGLAPPGLVSRGPLSLSAGPLSRSSSRRSFEAGAHVIRPAFLDIPEHIEGGIDACHALLAPSRLDL